MYCSVIIPARNAGRTIGECLLAVLSQSVPRELYEVLVVDDGSTDQTLAIARKCGARVVPQPALGPAAARNTGARVAKGDFHLLQLNRHSSLVGVAQASGQYRRFDTPSSVFFYY